VSLPLTWGTVPPDTVEIDLFVAQVAPVNNKLVAAYGLAGLRPNLRHLASGQIPRGAIVGRNQFGQRRWSICPHKGAGIEYVVLLDPLPKRIPVKQGFDVSALISKAVETAPREGRTAFTYKRL
jgi:hypothetical protein